jgi:hypothetical protein
MKPNAGEETREGLRTREGGIENKGGMENKGRDKEGKCEEPVMSSFTPSSSFVLYLLYQSIRILT